MEKLAITQRKFLKALYNHKDYRANSSTIASELKITDKLAADIAWYWIDRGYLKNLGLGNGISIQLTQEGILHIQDTQALRFPKFFVRCTEFIAVSVLSAIIGYIVWGYIDKLQINII